jgi:hypothetical protein
MHTQSNNSGNSCLPNIAPHPLVLPELHAIGRPTRKRSGEAAEAAFLAKASSLGFAVAKPWGDSERYDFILDSGHGFLSVQVKSTQRYAESRYRVKAAGWKDTYSLGEIDFLVAYIIPEDLWYVVPIAAFAKRKALRFYPHSGRKALYERYREAWCLLTSPCGAGAPARGLPKVCRCPEIPIRCAVCPLTRPAQNTRRTGHPAHPLMGVRSKEST